MKRSLLFTVLFFMMAVTMAQPRYTTQGMKRGEPLPAPAAVDPAGPRPGGGVPVPGTKLSNPLVIGNTWYDTQTYNGGNLMNRIYAYPDGSAGASWMYKAASGTPDRGSAYNYYNGTAWLGATLHLGNDPNNGFPSYAPWGPTGEILAHYQYVAGDGPIKLLRRTVKGTGDWVESVLPPPPGNYSLVWHSMITSGANHEFIHVLALVYDDPYQGQEDALLYYRSSDGGVTWEINGMEIEGLGSAYFKSISSLHYSWAQPVGNTIAFTYGFGGFDGLAFKSADNGNTWQKYVVYEAPWTPYTIPDITPVFGAGDGTSAIALDSQGQMHVVFGRMLWFYDVVTTPPGGWYYYPTISEGLVYWNESMPPLDSTLVSSYTLELLEAGGNLVGWVFPSEDTLTISNDQPNYGVGLTSQPQLAIDGDDHLYLVYSAISPENMIDDLYFRNIYSNASLDGGATWTGIRKLTSDFQFIYSECVFPAVAPVVGQTVHLLFQEDFAPGTGAGNENFMEYLTFPKEFFVGVGTEPDQRTAWFAGPNPNPARDAAMVTTRLDRAARVSVDLVALSGQVYRRWELGNLPAGSRSHTLNIAGVPAGIYTLVATSGTERTLRKLVVR